ncbi:hypothetical protein E4T45_13727 [Aureobasidium sp. EXF-8846]|nr:hypothetical protein E4T45_13727 [Aureobasidium sp. EXF-8846]
MQNFRSTFASTTKRMARHFQEERSVATYVLGVPYPFLEILPEVEAALRSQGQELPRPNYAHDDDTKVSSSAKLPKSEPEESEPEPEPAVDKPDMNTAPSTSKLDRFKYERKNHEATSDEED